MSTPTTPVLPVLFSVSYDIGTGAPGAPLFHVNLMVNVVKKTVTGTGVITQATMPPLHIDTRLAGQFRLLTLDSTTYIVVTLSGKSLLLPPMPNTSLLMLLQYGWKSGVADYTYVDSAGHNHEVSNVPVKVAKTKVEVLES
jgi:hypothetical protein